MRIKLSVCMLYLCSLYQIEKNESIKVKGIESKRVKSSFLALHVDEKEKFLAGKFLILLGYNLFHLGNLFHDRN